MQVSDSTSCRTSKQQDGQQQTLSTQERTTKDKQTWMLQEFTSGGKEKERTKESQKEKEKALESTAKEEEEKEKVMEKEKASTTKRAKDEEKEEEKEKGKGRGRGYGKGGGRGYNNKGKGKGYNNYNPGTNLCHYCQKPGHYEANCRLKQRDMQNARNVQEDDEQSMRTQTTTVPSSSASATTSRTTAAKSTAKPTVRQIAMYHMGDEPENLPEVFELDEDEEELEIEYFGRILRVTEAEEVCVSSGEESEIEQEEDPLLDWYLGREQLPHELQQAQEVLSVRAVGGVFPRKRSTRED